MKKPTDKGPFLSKRQSIMIFVSTFKVGKTPVLGNIIDGYPTSKTMTKDRDLLTFIIILQGYIPRGSSLAERKQT